MSAYVSGLRITTTDQFGVELRRGDNPYDLERRATFALNLYWDDFGNTTEQQREHLVREVEEGGVFDVGGLSFAVVDGYNRNWPDGVDALSGDYLHIAETFWSPEPNDFGIHVKGGVLPDTGGASNLLLLDSLTIHEPFRGHQLRLYAMGAVMSRISPGCAYAFSYPMKPGAEGDFERRSSADGLTRYYERLGFTPFADCIYVNFAYVHFEEAWATLLGEVDADG